MGSFIVKLRPGLDLYMVWSSNADNIETIGTAAELEADSCTCDGRYPRHIADPISERLDRADRYGTSMQPWKWRGRNHREGGWRDSGFVVHNNPEGWLERRHFLPFAIAIRDGKMAKATRLVRPFDDQLPALERRHRSRVLYRRRRG